MSKWVNVTECFSEKQRHYKNTYLEVDWVYDDVVEVSLFSSFEDPYEIYVRYGIMYGIIYVDEEHAYQKYEEIKKELEMEYEKHPEPTSEFINLFANKHHLSMPFDVLFDSDKLMETMFEITESFQ